MNVGLVTHEYPPDVIGGVSLHMSLLARGLTDQGHTVHVVTLGQGAETSSEEAGVRVHRVLCRSVYPKKGRLRESLRRFEYGLAVRTKLLELMGAKQLDLVQAHPMGGDLFFFSLQRERPPIVTHLSTMYRELAACEGWQINADLHLSMWMEDEVIMRSYRLIAPSKACAETVAHRLGFDPGTVTVIPHGIPITEPFTDAYPACDSSLPSGPRVLFVGRLESRKGLLALIRAIPRVLAQLPVATFALMGEDSYAGSAELAREGNAATSFKQQLLLALPVRYWPQVQFLGLCDDQTREHMMASCHVIVAPSLHESFGFIYLQAMARGKPVIGCRVGGVPEVVDDGISGLLIPPDDPEALAEAILRLLADPALRHRLGAAARQAVKERFSASVMVDRTLAVYEELLRSWGRN